MTDLSSRLTPINDLYPTCELTYATLAIGYIDPDLITKKLNLTPTRIQKKGIPRVMANGKTRIGNIDNWLLSSKNEISSKDIRRHIDWLLDLIEPTTSQLLEIQLIDGVKMSIRCVWWSAHGEGGPTLWPEQMERMAKLNLECTFSFAWYGDYNRRITPDQLLVHPEDRGENEE
jgi:hypothetical protein